MNQEVKVKTFFLYNGKKYEIRAQIPYRNQFLVTLVEVAE